MALTQVQSGILADSTQTYGMKNRIINGDMRIDQRNAGASSSWASSTLGYSLDRLYTENYTNGAMTVQQVSDAPAGFTNSAKVTVTTASGALGSTQDAYIGQRIEGYNFSDLAFGTASAQTTTLSFWVKSSLTGTFGGSYNNSAWTRNYAFTYTINSANTWEYKTVVVPGDTSGTWLTTNGIGLKVIFSLAAGTSYTGTSGSWTATLLLQGTGSTNLMGTLNATLQITGVQLEKGSTATQFDYRPYGTELAMCQRYFYKLGGTGSLTRLGAAHYEDSTAVRGTIPFPVTMRAIPTGTASGNLRFYTTSARTYTPALEIDSNQMGCWIGTTTTSGTAGHAGFVDTSGFTSSFIQFSAEL
jgi:hypothetical protein